MNISMNGTNTDMGSANRTNNINFGSKIVNFKPKTKMRSDVFIPEQRGDSPKKEGGSDTILTKAEEMFSGIKQKIAGSAKMLGIGAIAALLYTGANVASAPTKVVSVTVNENISTLKLAETYGISPEAISAYNAYPGINDDDKTIKVPSSFDYIGEKQKELRENISKGNINSNEINRVKGTINALSYKKTAQNKAAVVFADDKYVYLKMKETKKAEDVKKLFDIKDGALKDNNYDKIDFVWEKDKTGMGRGYMDYTHSILKKGQTYRVKISDIQKDNINLS